MEIYVDGDKKNLKTVLFKSNLKRLDSFLRDDFSFTFSHSLIIYKGLITILFYKRAKLLVKFKSSMQTGKLDEVKNRYFTFAFKSANELNEFVKILLLI